MKKWLKYIGQEKIEFIYIDFPWGGKSYKMKTVIDTLYLESYSWNYLTNMKEKLVAKKTDIYEFINKVSNYSDFIGLKLPYNFNVNKLKTTYPKNNITIHQISKSIIFIIINNS